MLNKEKFHAVEKAKEKYEAMVIENDKKYDMAIEEFENYKEKFGVDAVIEKYKSRPRKKQIKIPPVQLDPQVKQEIVCMILDTDYILELDNDTVYKDDKEYYTSEVIRDLIEKCISKIILPEDMVETWMPFYAAAMPQYDIPEIIGSINKKLDLIDRSIDIKKDVSPHRYKGYDGLLSDFYQAGILSKKTPINEKPFQLTKGIITYNVMTVLRNSLDNRVKELELEYEDKKRRNKLKKVITMDEYVIENMPSGPIICIENSIHNYVDNDDSVLKEIRKKIMKLAQAIIDRKVLLINYLSVGMGEEIDFEFHPHYIKQVGKRFICYGMSRLTGKQSEDGYKLVNIIISDIKKIEEHEILGDFQSEKLLGLDYNHEVFKDRMTYNAPKFNKEKDEPEEVVLKVRREIKTDTGYVKPYERILREPLHHSQEIAEDYGIDPEWGYIRLSLIDLMYITPILLTEGSKIEVLKPERLRNLMAQKVKELALLYYPNLDFETGQEPHKEQNTI